MTTGNRPADGGNLIIEEKDYIPFTSKEPKAKKYIKKLTGSNEFIKNINRYCLWLVDVSPNEIRKMPKVMKRIEACREDRLKGAPDRRYNCYRFSYYNSWCGFILFRNTYIKCPYGLG